MIEEKIKELGFNVPEAPKPLAAYVPANRSGEYVYTAGQLPFVNGQLEAVGSVGREVSEEKAIECARISVINCLSAIKGAIGDLDKIDKIVKVTAFVSSADGFYAQPKVANGASEFLVQVFGENGKHARSAVGVNALPMNAPVEIELIVKVK